MDPDFSKEPTLKPTIAERLNNVLDLDATPETAEIIPSSQTELVVSETPDKEMADDWTKARQVLHTLLDKQMDLLDNANFFAKEKQDARSVEAASIAGKEVRDTAVALLNQHKIRKDIERSSSGTSGDTITQNNAVFVGTTGELLKLTKQMNADGLLKKALEKAIDVTPLNNSEDNNA
jgi:ribonuclease HII